MKKRYLFIVLFLIIALIVLYFSWPNYINLEIDEKVNNLKIVLVEFDLENNEPIIRNTEYSIDISNARSFYIKDIVEEQKFYHNVKGVFYKNREERGISWQIQIYTNLAYIFINSNGNVSFNRYILDTNENIKSRDIALYSLGRNKAAKAQAIKKSILEIVQEN